MLSYPLVVVLLLAATQVENPRRHESTFSLTTSEIMGHSQGEGFLFRLRYVVHSCMLEVPQDTIRVQEGTCRVSYSPSGAEVAQFYADLLAEDDHVPVFRETRSHYSFLSGESATVVNRLGAIRPTAHLEHWSRLPSIIYYALGSWGPPLWDCLGDRHTKSESAVLESWVEHEIEDGTTISEGFRATGASRVLDSVVYRRDGNLVALLEFSNHTGNLMNRLQRPRSIVFSTFDEHGCIREATVWIELQPDIPAASGLLLPMGTEVLDYRPNNHDVASVLTDRALSLSALSVWASAVPVSTAALESAARGRIEDPVDPERPDLLAYAPFILLVIVVVVTYLAGRRKREPQ